MHPHKIIAQILLILSILNSVLAAPIFRVREIPGARDVVAARVPAEGVVAVLEKRPFNDPQPGTSPGPSPEQPQSTTDPEHLSPSPSTTDPEHPEQPQSATNPEHPESHSTQPPEPTEPEEVYHDASSEELGPPEPSRRPSKTVSIPKIMTPGKIKAVKYVGIASILTAAYLSLLAPTLANEDNNSNQGNQS